MAMSELKQRLLLIELAKIGCREAWYDDVNSMVYSDLTNDRMPRIHDNGDIHYGCEYDHLVKYQIQPMLERINEILAAWEKSQVIPFKDSEKFRVLAEYNNVVLAVRDDSKLGYGDGLHFVTWAYGLDRTGFDDGHYFTGYESAKENFALRCGLVDKNKMFDETEMKLIRQGLVHLGADFPDLTAEQMTLLGKVVERIEMLVPEITEHEEMEHSELVPDDGLEI
jgi:hypothetical protein